MGPRSSLMKSATLMAIIVSLVLAHFKIVKKYGDELVVTLGTGDVLSVHRYQPFNWVLLTQVKNVLNVSFSHPETRLFNLQHNPYDQRAPVILREYAEREKIQGGNTLYKMQIDMIDRETQFMLIVPIEDEPGDFKEWRRNVGLNDELVTSLFKCWTLQIESNYAAVVFKITIIEEDSYWCQVS